MRKRRARLAIALSLFFSFAALPLIYASSAIDPALPVAYPSTYTAEQFAAFTLFVAGFTSLILGGLFGILAID